MKRREFLLGAASVAVSSEAVRGQSVPGVGVLIVGRSGARSIDFEPALARLAEMGFVEGHNLTVEYRGANFKQERLAELASELVQRQVAAIVTMGGPPTVAAKAATKSIPIIFRTGFDPVTSGFVDSLNRPGGNVTGIYILNPQLLFKRIEVLHELAPSAKTIAFFYTPSNIATDSIYQNELAKAAESLGLKLVLLRASQIGEIETLFAKAEAEGAGAILVNDHPVFSAEGGKLITGLAARYKMPTMYPGRTYVDAGGLISYGSDSKEANRQLGDLVGRVLRGQKPQDLPVQQVTKLELVINAKTAKSLNLAIPIHLLALAEVIE